MKVLLVTMYFPPAGGGGVQRSLKLAQYLPALGIETHVLAPDDPKWVHRDPDTHVPTQAWIHRARYVGPRARKPAEELRAAEGLERALVQAQVTARRLLLPDASVTWNLTAIPAAIRLVRTHGIDADGPVCVCVGFGTAFGLGVRCARVILLSHGGHPARSRVLPRSAAD